MMVHEPHQVNPDVNPDAHNGKHIPWNKGNVGNTLLKINNLSMFLGYWSFRSRSKNTETNGVGRSMKMATATSG